MFQQGRSELGGCGFDVEGEVGGRVGVGASREVGGCGVDFFGVGKVLCSCKS